MIRHVFVGTGLCIVVVAVLAAAAAPPSVPAKSDGPSTKDIKGDPYPFDTCPVSGEKLGVDRQPVVKNIDGREVRFCCSGCPKLFEKDKAAFMKKLDDKIIEQQIKHYPLTHCVVMEEDELDSDNGSIVNHVYGNRLVRFCCRHCLPEFEKDPAKYLAKLDAAVIKQQKEAYPLTTCAVSGETLGAGAVDHVMGVTLVRLCDRKCVAAFHDNPTAIIAKVHDAWKARHSTENDAKH